ncbi:lycopene cyclase family protein [Rhodococcus sp. NPDC003318]|uniref:lycopene cyclase family protein n=1 Tax=Rhodococcus sp. NPDC003318 TaxID=3364503 RepID=UPI00368C6A4B
MSDGHVPDLAVVGLGPAGRALAHRAAAAGLDVVAVDPASARPWTPTYAAWADELPRWLGTGVVAARVARPRARGSRDHVLDREYVVLDNTALRVDLAGVRVVTGRAAHLADHTVTLDDGVTLPARRVVDARGVRPAPALAEQTAYGLVVPPAVAAPALADAEALFMDWTPDNGADPDAPPSFLYAVPLDADRVLLEETCLVGRPALGTAALRERLLTRLDARGVRPPADAAVERVRFPVQAPPTPTFAFGARGGMTHPGTGYSLAASLAAVDTVVDALVVGSDPAGALWTRRARAVRALRAVGSRALLALPPARVPGFFDEFFELPPELQRAYLSARDRPRDVSAAMWSLFRHASMPVRRTLIGAALPARRRGHR